jgi:hypothetical protein
MVFALSRFRATIQSIPSLWAESSVNESERNALKNVEKLVLKGLKGNEKEVRRILQFKSRLVELEMNRIKRLNS